jgi:hypothetical protein
MILLLVAALERREVTAPAPRNPAAKTAPPVRRTRL